MVCDLRLFPLAPVATCRSAYGKLVVDEHHAVANKAILPYGNELTDEGMGLDPRSGSDANVALNLAEGPNEAVVAYGATIYVHGLHEFHIASEGNVHDSRLSLIRTVVHCADPSRPKRHSLGANLSGTSQPVSTDS